jgi:PleD family two-component response regulator
MTGTSQAIACCSQSRGSCVMSCAGWTGSRATAARIPDHCTKSASFDTLARVTCSFGVCEYNGDEDADALVRRVDDLMYRARRSGRNGLVAG